nr:MAG TPA: hypothetical protein [Caudoviricetes sp.]
MKCFTRNNVLYKKTLLLIRDTSGKSFFIGFLIRKLYFYFWRRYRCKTSLLSNFITFYIYLL